MRSLGNDLVITTPDIHFHIPFYICDMIKRNESDIGQNSVQIPLFYIVISIEKILHNSVTRYPIVIVLVSK